MTMEMMAMAMEMMALEMIWLESGEAVDSGVQVKR
jgi:hypothetical protein